MQGYIVHLLQTVTGYRLIEEFKIQTNIIMTWINYNNHINSRFIEIKMLNKNYSSYRNNK